MTFREASEAVERIAESGVKSPFTFWVLLSVTMLGLIMAAGSFWLLNIQLNASQARYDRLFSVMEKSAIGAEDRELKMIDELQLTRREYSNNLQAMVQMLMEESPTKADTELRQAALSSIQENREAMKKLEMRQEKIGVNIQELKLLLDGKTGR